MASSYEHSAADAPPPADQEAKIQKKEHGHDHVHAEGQVAKIVALGAVTVGGATFTIDRDGQVESGKVTEFGVEHIGGAAGVKPSARVFFCSAGRRRRLI